ncbi:hypothetical protein-transmembrane prediction [Rhodopirellula baltica SH 1]|uniref:Uncharacterized protein n=1 Tax=Rhodopirellula baltica (strain DSM 10527 / NCIMB 13988 / SH1) TaxID=243090 RepID=Q7UN59_RHOBA|nr:hypothetical protein-transmembrane prediction [Rhodopirellula baltica SH 1]
MPTPNGSHEHSKVNSINSPFSLSSRLQDFLDHTSVDVRQTKIATSVGIRQTLVVDSKLMQHGRVQIVHVDAIANRVVAVIIGLTVRDAAANTATTQHHRKSLRVVVAAIAALNNGRPTKLAAPHNQRLLPEPALFQIRKQSRDWQVRLGGIFLVPVLQIAVLIPHLATADGDESNAGFCQPTRHQTTASKRVGRLLTDPVQFFCRVGLLG